MAPPSSDIKPPAPEERGDTSLDLQAERMQMAAPDSPAKTSPARDTSDGTGATTNKDLKHAGQQPSMAKNAPTLEVPDDLTSIKNEKHLPPSTPLSSAERPDLVDKATDGSPPDADSPRSGNPVSSANKRDSLDVPAGTRSSPQVTSHDAESTSSGKTSLIPTKANDFSSIDGGSAHGSAAVSLEDNSQADGASNDTSTPGSHKRTAAQSSTDGQLDGAHDDQHRKKKAKLTEGAMADGASGPGKALALSESPQQGKQRSDSSLITNGSPTTRKKTRGARQTASSSHNQPQQAVPAHEPAIDRKIKALGLILGVNGQAGMCYEIAPLANEPELRLEEVAEDLGLSAMEPFMKILQTSGSYNKDQLFRSVIILLFTSNECAPVLRQWKLECYDDPDMEAHLPFALLGSDSPTWAKEMHQLASCAMHYAAIVKKTMTFESEHREAIISCAKFVRRLVHCNNPYIMPYLNMCNFPDTPRFLFQFYAGMLITAYENLVNHPGSFFEILLNSPFATGITSEARPLWLHLLGLADADKDPRHLNAVEEVQKAALAYGATTLSKRPVSSEKLVTVQEAYYRSSARFTRIHTALHEEATRYVHLLTATNSQAATSALLRKTPSRIENHKNICTTPACKNKKNRDLILQDDEDAEIVFDPGEEAPLPQRGLGFEVFALSRGRIVPGRVLVADRGDPDPFTKQEELILFKRFKVVITALQPAVNDVTALSSEKWFGFWAKIAEVLPGRGVTDCVAFYVTNKEHIPHK